MNASASRREERSNPSLCPIPHTQKLHPLSGWSFLLQNSPKNSDAPANDLIAEINLKSKIQNCLTTTKAQSALGKGKG